MNSTSMRIGLGLPQVGTFADPGCTRRVAVAAELGGFDSLWTVDRVLTPASAPAEGAAVLDPLLSLTLAAAVTDRIALGTGVLIAPLYPAVLLARGAASLDRISGGRFTLGLGLGRSADEYAAVGLQYGGLQVRIEQMLEVLARVWRDEIVEIETTRETIVPSRIGPKPVRAPRMPLLLAGNQPASLERIARRADGWITTGLPFEDVAQRWQTVQQIAQRYGRETSALRLVVRADVQVTSAVAATGRPAFTGSIAQVRGDIERTRDLGAHELVLDLQGTASNDHHMLDLAFQLADGSLRRPTSTTNPDTKAA
jgi:probable F420-dependent oxidoreductase